MKTRLHFLIAMVLAFCTMGAKAQLVNGSIAPDFTFTDMNGKTQNLYSYLNAGKIVVIDVSAIWCIPCWNYHTSGALESFYNTYGPAGTDVAMVLFVEGDGATSDQCMANSSGCTSTGGPSQGNWVSGTSYPMCNPATAQINSFNTAYKIKYFPTCYMICPNTTRVTDVDQYTAAQLATEMNSSSSCPKPSTGVTTINSQDGFTIYPNPVTTSFTIEGASESEKVHYSIYNMVGAEMKTGDIIGNGIGFQGQVQVTNMSSGIYFLKMQDGNSSWVQKLTIR